MSPLIFRGAQVIRVAVGRFSLNQCREEHCTPETSHTVRLILTPIGVITRKVSNNRAFAGMLDLHCRRLNAIAVPNPESLKKTGFSGHFRQTTLRQGARNRLCFRFAPGRDLPVSLW